MIPNIGYKLALAVVFGVPAMLLGLRYAWRGVYRGLVERRIPMGEDPNDAATGFTAIAIGIYSAAMGVLLLGTAVYLGAALWPAE